LKDQVSKLTLGCLDFLCDSKMK